MYSILNLIRRILPGACPLCGLSAQGAALCPGCQEDLRRVLHERTCCEQCGACSALAVPCCAVCRGRPPAYARMIAAMAFAYPGDMLMRRLKERGQLTHARLFAELLRQKVQQLTPALPALQALVPIPAGIASIRRRGFNPAAEIARELSRSMDIPLRQSWLRRTREGSVQKMLGSVDRRQSVKGLYACDLTIPELWIGLVDDVMTTGSTLHEAARVLRQAGARGVVALVGARALRSPPTELTLP